VGNVDWQAESDLNSRVRVRKADWLAERDLKRGALGKVDWPAASDLKSREHWGMVTGSLIVI
jgi:hypothetical protein